MFKIYLRASEESQERRHEEDHEPYEGVEVFLVLLIPRTVGNPRPQGGLRGGGGRGVSSAGARGSKVVEGGDEEEEDEVVLDALGHGERGFSSSLRLYRYVSYLIEFRRLKISSIPMFHL